MSHIVKTKEDLMLVKDIFDEIRKRKVDVCLLEEVVINLLPKDNDGKMFSGCEIFDNNGGFSRFSLSDNCLRLSLDEMIRWTEFNSLKFIDRFGIKDVDLFKDYIFLMIIVHEIEHSYQYLMAKGLINVPCELVGSGYKLMIDTLLNNDELSLLKQFKNYISYYLYNKNSGKYVIERNANVEAFDLLQRLAVENVHNELSSVFNRMRNSIAIWGYVDSNRGSFEETFRHVGLYGEYKKFVHDYQLSDIERFRYGLPVSSEFMDKIKIRKLI